MSILFLLAGFLPLEADAPQASNQVGVAALKKLSLEELSQIEVTTPSKSPVRASETPAAIFIITGDDIRRSGATSIPEALRMAPGVEVARIDGSKWSIGIRGFGSRLTRSVLVMIDGRTVFTPLFDGTYWEVQDTMMEDIERIEVIRGPGGTIWGPNAVNGVINVITRYAKDTRGALVSAGGGNVEQGFLNARYGGNFRGANYRVYAKGFTRGPEDHSDARNFDDWRSVQSGFRMDWNTATHGTFNLQGDIYTERVGERVQATSYTQPYSQVVDANADLSGGNITGHWDKNIRPGNDIKLQIYYDRTSRFEPNLSDIRDTFDVDFLQHVQLPARNKISWGLGGRVGPVDNIEVVSGLTFDPAHRTDYLATAFFQDEIGLIDHRLALTVGTKLLRTNFTTGLSWEPSARLLWTPDEKQSYWAAYTHAVRTPSDVEANFNLSGYQGNLPDSTPFFARFIANPNFAPEQLNGYEAGYRRLIGKNVLVDATAYYNHYHDLFSENITGGPFFEATPAPVHLLLPAQFRNGLLAYTKGVELAPEWRPTSYWRLRGSYSYLHMNVYKAPNSGDVGSAPGIQGSSPQHQVMAQSSIDISKSLELDLDFRYVSALTGQMPPVAAYSTGDIRLAWRFAGQFELSLVGQNLFQSAHAEYAGDPGPLVGIKRNGYVKMTWSR